MQETKDESGNRKFRISADWFSVALVTVVMLSAVLAFVVYRQAFSADLSHQPDNWSAFGGFVGGVFGPLISFLTLLAILKTIGLQKDLLDTQRNEFETMQALQLKAVEAQLSQIRSSDAESARRLIEESRISALQALDKYLHGIRAEYEQKKSQLNSLYQWLLDGKAKASTEDMERMTAKLKEYEETLALMTVLYGDLCFCDFENVEELREKFQTGIAEIWHPSAKQPDTPKD